MAKVSLLSRAVGSALALSALSAAQAATHHVANNGDSGLGSLRQAIADANADATTPNIVVFDNTVVSPITLTGGEIAISKSMTVQGPGAGKLTISGNDNSRIFNVNLFPAGDVTISGLTLTHGKTVHGFHVDGNGGAIESNNANLTLQDSVLDHNNAGANGGGVSAAGEGVTVIFSNVTLSNNTSYDGVTYHFEGGGAALGSANVTISNSSVTGNSASTGGGIAAMLGAITIQDSIIAGNHAVGTVAGVGVGGGVNADQTSLTMKRTHISGNDSVGLGGGLNIQDSAVDTSDSVIDGNKSLQAGAGGLRVHAQFASGHTVTISSSTISGNTATVGAGGGIVVNADTVDTVTLTNLTVYGNHAIGYAGGGMYVCSPLAVNVESSTIAGNTGYSGGGVADCGSGVTLHNTIVANNTKTGSGGGTGADLDGAFLATFAMFSSTNGATFNVGSGNNLTGNPLLGPLDINGGPTPTMMLATNSPALNSGDPAYAGTPAKDQRGLPRKFGSFIDRGAVERQNPEDVIFRDGFDP